MKKHKTKGAVFKTAPLFTKYAVSFFILWNLVAIPFSTTKPRHEQNAIQKFFMPYLLWTRLLQSWPLFTPTPRKVALQYRAEIIFKDGTIKVWQRPYPPKWNFSKRHLSYNFQKWDLASSYLEYKTPLWNDLTNYLTKLYWNDSNPPVKIKFIRAMASWPEPKTSGFVGGEFKNLKWQDVPVFIYDIHKKEFDR